MNVALPAFIVFLLVLPGFIARLRIKRVERLSLDYSPFGQVVTEAVVWAAGMHALWIALAAGLFSTTVRADIALKLLSSDPHAQAQAIEFICTEIGAVALYFGSLIVFAYLAPMAVRSAIISARWDRCDARFSTILRFSQAPWYYLLSGADFAADKVPDFISISAIVNVAGKPYLYTGVLDGYFLDPDGQLDRLVLEEVMRKPLEKDEPNPDGEVNQFHAIGGDYFVLRYSEAITLNVEYVKLRAEEEPASSASAAVVESD